MGSLNAERLIPPVHVCPYLPPQTCWLPPSLLTKHSLAPKERCEVGTPLCVLLHKGQWAVPMLMGPGLPFTCSDPTPVQSPGAHLLLLPWCPRSAHSARCFRGPKSGCCICSPSASRRGGARRPRPSEPGAPPREASQFHLRSGRWERRELSGPSLLRALTWVPRGLASFTCNQL